MSKVFSCLALMFSALMLFVGLTGSTPAKPTVMIFWLLVGTVSAYKLFRSPSKA
ncbi:MAG TPA: hypothetical protein VER76_14330 [Pyrinomonadaceae bacterium]|nr:hypothetical protein [Pyrinomonadaceae bacterium]